MNGVGSPFKKNLLTIIPTTPRVSIFVATIGQEKIVALSPKTADATNVKTASLAVHGTKGIRRIVRSLALLDSIILAPRTAGTLQPKPRNMGRKLFQCRQIPCI